METILMFMIFRSYVMLLEQKRNKDLQNTGLNGNSNPDLYDDGAMLHQLRYQANWSNHCILIQGTIPCKNTKDLIHRKIHCLTGEFHGKFQAKNQHRTNREEDECNISFSSESEEKTGISSASAPKSKKKKAITDFRVNCHKPENRNHAKIRNHRRLLSFESPTRAMTDHSFGNL